MSYDDAKEKFFTALVLDNLKGLRNALVKKRDALQKDIGAVDEEIKRAELHLEMIQMTR